MKQERVYKAVCEYNIVCESPAVDTRPFPRCSDINWGAGSVLDQYGLVPSHRLALLAAVDGRVEVSFTKLRPVRLHARLVSETIRHSALEKCVSMSEQDNQVCDAFITGREGRN